MPQRKPAAVSEENTKVGVLSFVGPVGPESMFVCGIVVSTVKVRLAGVGSTFPAGSIARTSIVCSPSASSGLVYGVGQEAKPASSIRHSKVEPGSVEANSKVGVLMLVGPLGPAANVVSGTCPSACQSGSVSAP